MKRQSPLPTLILAAFALVWMIFRLGAKRASSPSLGQIVVEFFPIFFAVGVAAFLKFSNDRQRIGVLLTLVFPGLGHLWLKHKERGIFFAVTLVPLFLAGMVLAGFANISPFDRHPIWALAHAAGGLMSIVAWLCTQSVTISWDNPWYGVGCLYSGTACLLNLLVMCDAWDLEGKNSPLLAQPVEEAPRANPPEAAS